MFSGSPTRQSTLKFPKKNVSWAFEDLSNMSITFQFSCWVREFQHQVDVQSSKDGHGAFGNSCHGNGLTSWPVTWPQVMPGPPWNGSQVIKNWMAEKRRAKTRLNHQASPSQQKIALPQAAMQNLLPPFKDLCSCLTWGRIGAEDSMCLVPHGILRALNHNLWLFGIFIAALNHIESRKLSNHTITRLSKSIKHRLSNM